MGKGAEAKAKGKGWGLLPLAGTGHIIAPGGRARTGSKPAMINLRKGYYDRG